jgi:hypothetical protein
MSRVVFLLERIACQELEAWYLGEPEALAKAFDTDHLRTLGRRARFRDPDAVAKPSSELARLIPSFQKVSGARRLAGHLTREGNCSPSFRALMAGLDALATELGAKPFTESI